MFEEQFKLDNPNKICQKCWDESKPVYEIKINENQNFYRFYNRDKSQISGEWVFSEHDMSRIVDHARKNNITVNRAAQEIFALPKEPTGLAKVTPPRGTSMQVGTAAANDWGPGGGIQFKFNETPDPSWFEKIDIKNFKWIK